MKKIISLFLLCLMSTFIRAQTSDTGLNSVALEGKSFKITFAGNTEAYGSESGKFPKSPGVSVMSSQGGTYQSGTVKSAFEQSNTSTDKQSADQTDLNKQDKSVSGPSTRSADESVGDLSNRTLIIRFENGRINTSLMQAENMCPYNVTSAIDEKRSASFMASCSIPIDVTDARANSVQGNSVEENIFYNEFKWDGVVTGEDISGTLSISKSGGTSVSSVVYSFRGYETTEREKPAQLGEKF